jgi:alpha-tubulin suppressor-like RCC1 family protein
MTRPYYNYNSANPIDFETYLQQNAVSWADLDAMTNGNMWATGDNSTGALGQGNTTNQSSLVQVGSLLTWRSLSVGWQYNAAVDTSNNLYTWGSNSSGQLGQGNITNQSAPVQVLPSGVWNQVFTSGNSGQTSFGTRTDGSLWTWGLNTNGQLGLGDTTPRSSPVQVGSLTNWAQIAIATYNGSVSGTSAAGAVKNDGSLWTWGYNVNGQCGQGNTTNLSSPVQVGLLNNWKQLACGYLNMIGVKTDGTLWSWGYNSNGVLGQGSNLNVNVISPVQVGTLTNWASVSCGVGTWHAVKTDGTLWTCGYNNFGGLGLSDTATRSSPVQVGSLTNWQITSDSGYSVAAVKTDGTLWTWGYNLYGNLGLGNTTNISSPVQVGSLTNWKTVGSTLKQTLALYWPQSNSL